MKMNISKGKSSKFARPFPYYTVDVLDPVVLKLNRNVQEEMVEVLFPPWLWEQLQHYAIAPSFDDQLEMMRVAVRQKLWEWYPVRPTSPVPSSTAFQHLEALLSNAPSHTDNERSEDMVYSEDLGTPDYEWSRAFDDSVNDAVDDVEAEHGEYGKLHALWVLYDTYCRCIRYRGLVQNDGSWEDDAAVVFRGPL